MSTPLFYLQIVSAHDGVVAKLPGGGALETDLTDLFVQHIMAKGVSWKTRGHVEKDVRHGITDAIMSMKAQTKLIVA